MVGETEVESLRVFLVVAYKCSKYSISNKTKEVSALNRRQG